MKELFAEKALEIEPLTWVEIDLKAIAKNYKILQKIADKNNHTAHPVKILAVVKADAYGHGMPEVASVVDHLGCDFYGVADVQEAAVLRKRGINKKILIFGSMLPAYAEATAEYDCTATVCSLEFAAALDKEALRLGKKVDVHVKIDTGMGRLGVWHAEAEDFIIKLRRLEHVNVTGIYTHFPSADTMPEFTQQQIDLFNDLVDRLKKMNITFEYVHGANSMGLAHYKNICFNLARPGLMLYGMYPDAKAKREGLLQPAMSIKSRVIYYKKVGKGRGISYGHTYVSKGEITIATLPIGYNDGYLRELSNKAVVLIGGKRCPVVGRVTMDQTMVDISAVREPYLGMPAVILGEDQGTTISADDLAAWAGTINYEIVCSLGNRLPRIFKN